MNILLSIEPLTLESLGPRWNEHAGRVYDKMGDHLIRFLWMFQLMREADAAHGASDEARHLEDPVGRNLFWRITITWNAAAVDHLFLNW